MTIMTSNFDFPKEDDPLLDHLGLLAKQYFPNDQNMSLLKLRKFSEVLIQHLADGGLKNEEKPAELPLTSPAEIEPKPP